MNTPDDLQAAAERLRREYAGKMRGGSCFGSDAVSDNPYASPVTVNDANRPEPILAYRFAAVLIYFANPIGMFWHVVVKCGGTVFEGAMGVAYILFFQAFGVFAVIAWTTRKRK